MSGAQSLSYFGRTLLSKFQMCSFFVSFISPPFLCCFFFCFSIIFILVLGYLYQCSVQFQQPSSKHPTKIQGRPNVNGKNGPWFVRSICQKSVAYLNLFEKRNYYWLEMSTRSTGSESLENIIHATENQRSFSHHSFALKQKHFTWNLTLYENLVFLSVYNPNEVKTEQPQCIIISRIGAICLYNVPVLGSFHCGCPVPTALVD